MRRISVLLAFLALSLAVIPRAFAQGGPPFITDDPGTPGDKKWEINVAWTTERVSGETLEAAPLLDANYGIGDRIELTYVGSWNILQEAGEQARSGMSESLLGSKWRFYDAGEKGWQASVYPQVTFLTPDSRSDRRGVAEGATTLLLPFEVQKDLGPVSINFDCGHNFSNEADARGWMGGVIVGGEVKKGLEFDGEVHLDTNESATRSEVIVNGGTRIDLSEKITLMLTVGTDLSNSLGPRVSLLTYVGFQFRL